MSLRGLGNFAGGAATGYLKSREDLRRQAEEDRIAKERTIEEEAGRAYGIGSNVDQIGGSVASRGYGDYDESGPVTYGLGGKTQDMPFTQDQRHTAGLTAAAGAAARGGSMRQAIEYTSKAQDAEARGLQIRQGQRTEMQQGREDEVRKMWADPAQRMLSKFNSDVGRFGEGNNAGKKGNIVQIPGTDNHLIWEVDADGKQKGDAKVVPKAAFEAESQREMLADLAIANPDKYLGAAISAGHSASQLAATVDHYKDQALHQLRQDGLTGAKLEIESKKLDAHIKEVTGRLGLMAKAQEMAGKALGAPIGLNKEGTKLLFHNPKGEGLVEKDVPPGYEGLFPKTTGERVQRSFPAEVDKAAAANYNELNMDDPKALGAFDRKYPGWRDTHFGTGGGLKITGAAKMDTTAAAARPAPVDPFAAEAERRKRNEALNAPTGLYRDVMSPEFDEADPVTGRTGFAKRLF